MYSFLNAMLGYKITGTITDDRTHDLYTSVPLRIIIQNIKLPNVYKEKPLY
jgi:hypothetical protein